MIKRLERTLESQLDNEQLQYRQANNTIKEIQEELGKLLHTHPFYRL